MNRSTNQKANAAAAATQTADTVPVPIPIVSWTHQPIIAPDFEPSADTPIAAISVAGMLRLYCLSQDNHLFQLEPNFDGSSWTAQNLTHEIVDLFPEALSNVAAVALANTEPRVYYLSTGNKLRELAFNGQAWSDVAILEGLEVASDTPLVALTRNNLPKVYLLTPDNHVHEFDYVPDKGWVDTDLTKITGAPGAQPLSALSCNAVPPFQFPSVYFLSNSSELWKLAWDGNKWAAYNLTQSSRAKAQARSSLASLGYVNAPGLVQPQLYFLSANSDVHQLSVLPGTDSALNFLAGVEPATAHSPLACSNFGTIPRVYYLDPDLNVCELRSEAANTWINTNFTAAISSPLSEGLSPITAITALDGLHVVYNSASGGLTQLVLKA